MKRKLILIILILIMLCGLTAFTIGGSAPSRPAATGSGGIGSPVPFATIYPPDDQERIRNRTPVPVSTIIPRPDRGE